MLPRRLRESVDASLEAAHALRDESDAAITRRAEDRPDGRTERAALVIEAVRRATGCTLYDVQVAGGLTLVDGHLAEMATGEGKTLTVALPCAMAALAGRQVHVATPTDYLAERDAEELRPVYEMLGLTATLLPDRDHAEDKPAAYEADVVYGPGYEFGFDHLRDHAAQRAWPEPALGSRTLARMRGEVLAPPAEIQPRRELSIIDEIDCVLLDEATTPLVLSAVPEGQVDLRGYRAAARRAAELVEGEDFRVEGLGVELSADVRGETPPAVPLRRPWWQEVRNALVARRVFREGEHYVLNAGEIQLVDGNTGRVFEDRTWQAGLHQAVQLKERVEVTAESVTAARMTRQRFAREYETLTGLTGTAMPAAREFLSLYGLRVVAIPRRTPSQRIDRPTHYTPTAEAKYRAVAVEAAAEQRAGRPVLVGCRTIAESRAVSEELTAAGVSHDLLNGLQDRAEAEIIGQAGTAGRVTVATNMAGRGTDIRPDDAALAAGGLHVVAVGRNASQRVDRQLVGRAARQGQPGSSRFVCSAEDALWEASEPKLVRAISRLRGPVSPAVDAWVDRLQKRLERDAFRSRLDMLRQEEWVDRVLHAAAG